MENVAYKKLSNSMTRVPVSFRKPKFQSLDSRNLNLNNLVCSRDTEFGIEIGRTDGYVKFNPEIEKKAVGDFISFKVNGYIGRFYFDASFLNLLLSDLNLTLPFYDMPVEMQLATLNASLSRVQKSINKTAPSLNIEIISCSMNSRQASTSIEELLKNPLKLVLGVATGSESVQCGLEFESSAFSFLWDFFVNCDPLEKIQSSFSDVPVELSVIHGWQVLSFSELSSLNVNDVVLIEKPDANSLIVSASDTFNFLISANNDNENTGVYGQQFTLVKELEGKLMENHMTNQDPSDTPNEVAPSEDGESLQADTEYDNDFSDDYSPISSGTNVSQLPVNLVFELGRKMLTFQEAQYVEVGYTFDLSVDPNNSVDILANGTKIGRAEIVEIAGRLGARVVEINR